MKNRPATSEPIGGYFGLELRDLGTLHHDGAMAVSSGRGALYLILQQLEVKKLYLPHYVGCSILQPLRRLSLQYSFYHIDERLEPVTAPDLKDREYMLYVNYFGVKNEAIAELTRTYTNIIVDNTQAFFCPADKTTPSFYSARKFFGVPDGGFAYLPGLTGAPAVGHSYARCAHLLKRLDGGPEFGFDDFRDNERSFESEEVTAMSRLTESLLRSIEYADVRRKRFENFASLESILAKRNELKAAEGKGASAPMVYPFLSRNPALREDLRRAGIYVAQYWPEIAGDRSKLGDAERYLMEHLVPLPIDQRYGSSEMLRIAAQVEEHNG